MESVNGQFKSRLTLRNPSPASDPHAPSPNIDVTLHYTVTQRDIFRSPDGGTLTLLRQHSARPMRSLRDCLGTVEKLRNDPRGFAAGLSRFLTRIGVPDRREQKLMVQLLTGHIHALAPRVQFMPEVLRLEWTVERVEDRVLCEGDDHALLDALRRGIDEYYNDDGCPMVPTAKEALSELAAVEGGGGGENCVVCLEELVVPDGGGGGGSKAAAAAMPCRHVFHKECIVGWLKTSHYCPICRFEMPAATTTEEEEEERQSMEIL